MAQTITSTQNTKIKEVAKLTKRGFRDRLKQTVVEGGREIEIALAANLIPDRVFVCRPFLDDSSIVAAELAYKLFSQNKTALYEVSPDVFTKIAYRDNSGGLLAVIPYLDCSFQNVSLGKSPLILVVEGAEKPGNLGALLRTADSAGVDAVIVCGEGTDIHNPNVIRASLGAVFALPIVQTQSVDAIEWLQANSICTVAATPNGSEEYNHVDMVSACAIAVGSESHGLTKIWVDSADHRVCIPMFGRIDSLNLSASAAILLYEAVRQRGIECSGH